MSLRLLLYPAILIIAGLSSPLAAQSGQFFLRDTFCSNQLIIVGNQVFDASNPMGQVVLPGAAANGSDSTVFVELVFNQPVEVFLNSTICEDDTLWVNGTAYHAGFYLGQETVQEGAANGCDSIININLTFKPSNYDFETVICEGDTIYVNGTAYHALHPEGTEVIFRIPCDSVIHVKITAIPAPFSMVADTLCPNDFLLINGRRYDVNNRAGYEIIENGSSIGCDSIVAVDLEFRNLWVYAGEDQEFIKGDFVCISPLFGITPTKVEWIPRIPCADSLCVDTCFRATEAITFTLVGTDVSGCVLLDDIRLTVSSQNRVYAPNVMNPDARWPNNRFFLDCDGGVVNIRKLIIADRWGEVIFEKFNIPPGSPDDGWDGYYRGQVVNPDTFVFYAELERFDGTTFEKTGGFSLVR